MEKGNRQPQNIEQIATAPINTAEVTSSSPDKTKLRRAMERTSRIGGRLFLAGTLLLPGCYVRDPSITTVGRIEKDGEIEGGAIYLTNLKKAKSQMTEADRTEAEIIIDLNCGRGKPGRVNYADTGALKGGNLRSQQYIVGCGNGAEAKTVMEHHGGERPGLRQNLIEATAPAAIVGAIAGVGRTAESAVFGASLRPPTTRINESSSINQQGGGASATGGNAESNPAISQTQGGQSTNVDNKPIFSPTQTGPTTTIDNRPTFSQTGPRTNIDNKPSNIVNTTQSQQQNQAQQQWQGGERQGPKKNRHEKKGPKNQKPPENPTPAGNPGPTENQPPEKERRVEQPRKEKEKGPAKRPEYEKQAKGQEDKRKGKGPGDEGRNGRRSGNEGKSENVVTPPQNHR